VNEVFERRRAAIRLAREELAEATYRQRMLGLKRGDFDSEDEALDGISTAPIVVTDECVLQSFADTLDTVKAMRETVREHGPKWTETVRDKWLREAEELERDARIGLGLDEELAQARLSAGLPEGRMVA
jgi:hypothetical protein